jgi:hypothetical protein
MKGRPYFRQAPRYYSTNNRIIKREGHASDRLTVITVQITE